MKKCIRKVHSPSLRIPWIFIAFRKCKEHMSYLSTQTFCCQLEELIRWLYNVADVTNHLTPPKSDLTGLKSSLQLYRVICGPGFWLFAHKGGWLNYVITK